MDPPASGVKVVVPARLKITGNPLSMASFLARMRRKSKAIILLGKRRTIFYNDILSKFLINGGIMLQRMRII